MDTSSDRPSILLDTMIVAGIYAAAKVGDAENLLASQTEWRRIVKSLIEKAELKNIKLVIPRPVFYELMSMNKTWYDYVIEREKNPIFNTSTETISDEILKRASLYAHECRAQFGQDDGKLKSYDPLIAAYAAEAHGYVITENQKDFSESHFQVVAIDTAILKGKDVKGRRIIFLLKSRT